MQSPRGHPRLTLGGFRRLTPRFSTRSGRSRASRRGLCAALASGGAMAPLVEALGAPSSATAAVISRATHNAGTVDWNNGACFDDRTAGGSSSDPAAGAGSADDPSRPHDARKDPRRTLAYVRLLAQLADHRRDAVDESGRGHDLVGRLRLWSRTTSPRRRGASRRARCEPPKGWTTTVRIRNGPPRT